MEEYISKSALVAEIEKRKHKLLDHIICESDKEWVVRTAHQLNRILLFLDTLEVKEVDLEKEVEDYWHNSDLSWCRDAYSMTHIRTMLSSIAKHFFELGLKAQKGE